MLQALCCSSSFLSTRFPPRPGRPLSPCPTSVPLVPRALSGREVVFHILTQEDPGLWPSKRKRTQKVMQVTSTWVPTTVPMVGAQLGASPSRQAHSGPRDALSEAPLKDSKQACHCHPHAGCGEQLHIVDCSGVKLAEALREDRPRQQDGACEGGPACWVVKTP